MLTKAFISYHHADQTYKDHLCWLARAYGIFEDRSVGTGDIQDDDRSSESIRRQIRDEYLRDSEVTILLCGVETRWRKHVDWELKSSMIDGRVSRRSGVLVVNLPGVAEGRATVGLPQEREVLWRGHAGPWTAFARRSQFEEMYPLMPARITDNLLLPKRVAMSVVHWNDVVHDPTRLKWLVDATAAVGRLNDYDLRRPMRRRNHTGAGLGVPRLEPGMRTMGLGEPPPAWERPTENLGLGPGVGSPSRGLGRRPGVGDEGQMRSGGFSNSLRRWGSD